MNRTAVFCTCVATAGLLGASALLTAGPLNPPAGAVSSTYKTLSEVEPRIAISAANTPGDADSVFRIAQPGSYYLTGNVTGAPGKFGIEIAASGVTIDLGGFELVGVGGSRAGIATTVTVLARIVIKNGSVRGWAAHGVDLGTVAASRARIEGVRADLNAGSGIVVGNDTLVHGCAAAGNGVFGIYAGSFSTIIECVATNNSSGIGTGGPCILEGCMSHNNAVSGFYLSDRNTATKCTASGNSDMGFRLGVANAATGCAAFNNGTQGFYTLSVATLTDCSASANTTGFLVGSRSSVIGCNASDNGFSGIVAEEGCTITDCTAVSNSGPGIAAGFSCTITGCNVSENAGSGLTATDGCNVSNCTASNNGAIGLALNNGCRISGCMTRNNQFDGIYVNFSCEVTQNNCNGDGVGAGNQGGIRVAGQANRIDSNNVTFADRGLLVDQGGNIIVRNTAKGCTVNYAIVAGNSDAQILGVGTGFSATNPWANFSY